jgi:hypothetical protein
MIAQLRSKEFESLFYSAAKNFDEFFKFQAHLVNELLALIEVHLRIIAREAVACSADGKALFIQQAADLANDQHVLALVIAAIAAALDGF